MSMIDPELTPHLLIKASAGTGKTHQLSLRILRLLALKTTPSKIIALTFTRTAAAEFVRRAIKLIKDAAENPKSHAQICEDAGLDPDKHTQASFKELLAKTLLEYDQMLLGTLDSYFARLVNNFPLEVGLEPGKASTVPEHEEANHQRAVIEEIMREVESDKTLRALMKEYKPNKEDSESLKVFAQLVKDYLRYYSLCPDGGRWAVESAIWGDRMPEWVKPDYYKDHHDTAWKTFGAWVEKQLVTDEKGTVKPAPLGHIRDAESILPTPDHKKALNHLFDFFEIFLTRGIREVTYNSNPMEIEDRVFDAIAVLHRCYAGEILRAAMQSSQGLYQILRTYRLQYDAIALRTGRLTFQDYVNLLQANFIHDDQKGDTESLIEQIHFRLDCQLDHWMLDEFQDTSTPQYAVLSKNVGEILMDDFGKRSVFVVGDLKQSLYEWREGNRRLLNQIEADFIAKNDAEPGTAITQELSETWRCAPAVLALVNAQLGKLEHQHVGDSFPAAALEDWQKTFKTQIAKDTKKKGEALWVEVRVGHETSTPNPDDSLKAQAAWVAHHLMNTPGMLKDGRLSPGISCAVLVSTNPDAAAFAEALRKLKVRATDESVAKVTLDNPVTIGLLSIIQHAIHPDNMKAKAIAEMSPQSRGIVESFAKGEEPYKAWSNVITHVASTFSASGARALIDSLISKTNLSEFETPKVNAEQFIAHRLRQLRSIASDYDETGERNLTGFVDFASKVSLSDATSPDSVQVITIHSSKGLEYDAVYMPLLESSRTMGEIKHDDMIYALQGQSGIRTNSQFKPAWIMKNVPEAVTALDQELHAGVENVRAEAAYGSLCRLYVGMTRAKHRIILIHSKEIKEPKKTAGGKISKTKHKDPREAASRKYDFLDLTMARLSSDTPEGSRCDDDMSQPGKVEARCLWRARGSSADWIEDRIEEESKAAALTDSSVISDLDYSSMAARRMKRFKPSNDESQLGKNAGSKKFGGKVFGTLVHSMFEGLRWDIDGFLDDLTKGGKPSNKSVAAAKTQVDACLRNPEVRQLLLRNKGGELWTEKHAVIKKNDSEYTSAIFDRVQIDPGKSAVIVDYKTTNCTRGELIKEYTTQMVDYRKSVARLCALPLDAVETWLIHVREDGSEAVHVV
jgi:ATP-dependent helicase/nuclease subunit A